MAIVYILYSDNLDRYYIGSCLDLEQRIQQHILNNKGFTARAQDWKIFFKIINLEYQQAQRIEKHIKNMKSKTYLVNLKKYDEITQELIQKYK